MRNRGGSAASVDQAALAFSVLSTQCAEVVNRRLSISERMLLREGLSRMHNASDADRMAAVRMLAADVKRGFEWPRPRMHDDADCPFHIVNSHPQPRVIEVLERMAQRQPLQVAVALCHLRADDRLELWNALSIETHATVVPILNDVHGVSTVQTRQMAKDLAARLNREIRVARNPGLQIRR